MPVPKQFMASLLQQLLFNDIKCFREVFMDFTLHTENLRVTGDIEEFVQKKLSKLGRYLPNITSVHVELEQQNSTRGPDVLIAQITLRHSRGAILRTEERVEKQDYNSVKTAISNASDKMYRRISRFKGKRLEKRSGREKYMMSPEELAVAEPLPSEDGANGAEEYGEESFEEPEVIRRKDIAVSAMVEEEAIEQMELLGHNFFLFFNADTNSVNVVYKRASGGYGVLQPRLD
jgi:putative sigma-54 modulation protein